MAEEAGRTDAFLSAAIDYAAAAIVGLFIAASLWLWTSAGDGVALATLLTGLPICF